MNNNTLQHQLPEQDVTLADVLGNGRFLLQQVNTTSAVFVPVTTEIIENSPFLDHRMAVPANHPKFSVPIKQLIQRPLPAASGPSRYLMHTSHVGSTLVSRVLGLADETLSLREPLPLRFLSSMRSHLDDNRFHSESNITWPDFLKLQSTVLALLNRPVDNKSRVLVKCTSFTNNAADTFCWAATEPARVVGISTSLDEFVASMLKSQGGKADLMNNAAVRHRRLVQLLPGYQQPRQALRESELAAQAWLVELLSIQGHTAKTGALLHWLNFDDFLDQPHECAALLATHLDLPWAPHNHEQLEASGLLTRYSKTVTDKPFTAADRQMSLRAFMSQHPGVTQKANTWFAHMVSLFPHIQRQLPRWASPSPVR